MEQPWLDSLSEDWESQPRDSPRSLPSKTPSLPSDDACFASQDRSQTRLPRISTRNSLGSSKANGFLRTRSFKSSKQGDNDGPVLAEHSSSKLNVAAQQVVNRPDNKCARRSSLPKPSSRAVSEASNQSVQHHSLHFRSSRGSVVRDGAAAGGETPEWKRRLIHGEGITKDKKDLFAPMGLQNVFRPPTIGKGTVAPKSENKKTNPWSKLSADTQDRTTPDLGFSTSKRGSTMKRPEMTVLEEASEEGSVRHRSLSAPEAFDGEQDNQDPAHEFQDPSRELENPVDPAIDDPRARTVSGQEEIRNEVISPIIVSKTNTVDGTDYQAYTNSMRRLHGTLEEAATGERPRPISRLSDHGIDYGVAADALQEFSALDSQAHDWTSHSLPDDLSVGTPDIVSNDPFVNLRRGGYSRDGSFHKRNLSASSFLSSMRPSLEPHGNSSRDQLRTTDSAEASQIISRVPPTAPTPPNIPSSPPVSQKTPSSGSPLKLFGKYDTFTNDKLLKRMSQYEETFEEGSGGADDGSIKATAQHRSSARSSLQFGSDQCDDYDFDVDVSRFPTPIPRDPDETESPKLPRNTQRREQIFHRETNGSGETRTKRVVKVSRQSSAETAHRIIQIEKISKQRVSHNDQHNPTLRQDEIHPPGEGKRAMNSPRRGEPVTKRRRTLLTDEIENLAAQLQTAATAEDRHIVTRSLAGQKRKDARYENDGRTADPDVLASRQILRPRNPTPSQAKSFIKQQISESPEFANEPEIQSLVLHLEEVETPGVDEDSKTEAVAEELASFGVGIAQMMSETRKGSITTRDFLKEATKIMDIIRAKGRPSPLDSVLEGDMKSSCSGSPSMFESTADRFSRPPSRDGVSLRKTREPTELDPRIISHLRKFEDRDESELVMDSSRASLHLEREEEQGDGEGDASVLRTGAAFESSPSNIRIRDNPNSDRKRKHSASTVPEEATREHNDIPTHSSSGESMNRTIPTSSSTSSGLRGVIPSDKVSHLIPEQIGGMTFDRNKQRWIKDHRSSDKGTRRKGRTESSEDDPFRDIPDLSVDEMEELKRREALIKAKNGTVKEQSPGEDGPHPLRTVSTIEEESDQASSGESRPHTREGAPTIPPNTSSAPSKESRFEFSVPPPATRATSWGEEDILPKAPVQRRAVAPQPAPASHMDDVEHEIRIHEGRVSTVPNQSDRENRQPRAVTIAFSSPLVSHIGYQDNESSLDNDSLLGTKIGSPAVEQFRTSSNSVQSLVHQYEQTTRSSSSRRIHSREGIRPFSLDGHQFAARPISRIEERNEDSPERELSMIHQPSESKAVATPAHATSSNALAVVPSTKNSRNWSFHLSPLPEFTVNQVDHSLHLEVSYIAGRMQHSSVRQVHGTLSLSVEDMVKHITDVEAYEPYWEYMRQLNLRGKGLISLHRLKEFCSRLDKLDVSNNKIGQLGDIPYSVRTLNIQRNCLTDMTSWGHLTNLQYLDVSGNELETLEGFGCLMHLRELKANRNMIRSIDGILDLDGLLVLKLSGNQLTAVDFEACELTRLRELDLSGNELTSVKNLDSLPALESLDLSGNRLEDQSQSTTRPLYQLQSLRLGANKLTTLDLENFPSLKLLYLDNNNLTSVTNLSGLLHLDSLSLRDQSPIEPSTSLDIPPNEARKVYLSSNLLPTTPLLSSTPTLPFLNIQYLELSSAGLQSLPDSFGQRAPNIRTLNLNFNALHDITPLLGIVRLNKLLLAGNRLSRLRKTCLVLSRFKALAKVDLRNNPVTVGFYPALPPAENRVVLRWRRHGKRASRDDSENQQEELLDPYTFPAADVELDRKYVRSLDTGTRMRRRVLELLLAGGNELLREVDGLAFEGAEMLGRRDEVWEGMVRAGVIKNREIEGGEGDKLIREGGVEQGEEGERGTS